MVKPLIHAFFDAATSTVTHVVADPATMQAAVIDSVLDYNAQAGRVSEASARRVIDWVREEGLSVQWLLETHAHADHLSAAQVLKRELGGRIAIGRHIGRVQHAFQDLLNLPELPTGGAGFDHLFDDGDVFSIGTLQARVMHTPGHTPACVSYLIESDAGLDVFIGDTLFMPDYGSARCDFPGGDAGTLYASVRKLLSLPSDTRLHLCHDYPPAWREAKWICTVAEQREHNIHVHDGVDEAAFVEMRTARDRTLSLPALLWPSIQVNVRAGELPEPESNGRRYLKIPLES